MLPALLVCLSFGAGFEVGDTKSPPPPAAKKADLVWSTSEVVEKAGDRTFVAAGTKKGERYVFHARGVCVWQSIALWTQFGPVRRARIGRIFGIDFRVQFGAGEKKMMNVGERRPEQTELTFVADSDDVAIRITDAWDLPEKVLCTVDGIEVR